MKANDSLLIYYAGHGKEIQGDGYWIPTNGERDDNTYWVSNDFITKALKNSKSKNILVISDSCYSGTLSRGIAINRVEKQKSKKKTPLDVYQRTKTRMVITSGNLEPVLDGGGGDHSVFARGLIEILLSSEESITATNIYSKLSELVVRDAQQLGVQQVPTMAALNQAGHLGPDYVFYQK